MAKGKGLPVHVDGVMIVLQSILYFFIVHFIDPFRQQKSDFKYGGLFDKGFPSLLVWGFVAQWAFWLVGLFWVVWASQALPLKTVLSALEWAIISMLAAGGLYALVLSYPVYWLYWLLVIFPHRLLLSFLKEARKPVSWYWVISTIYWAGLSGLLAFCLHWLNLFVWRREEVFIGTLLFRGFGFLLINVFYSRFNNPHDQTQPETHADILDSGFEQP